jgi:hypothetical protein
MRDAVYTFTDQELERAIDRAYREAVRCVQEVRAYCSKHGFGGHDSTCVMLGESAREADRFWHHLMDEKASRKAASPFVRRALTAQLPAKAVA